MFDTNAETFGLNRRKMESLPDYLKRVFRDPIFTNTACEGMQDGCFYNYQTYNARCKTHAHTYYFSVAGGLRCRKNEKSREILREPTKAAKSSVGFDLRANENIKYRGSLKKNSKRD